MSKTESKIETMTIEQEAEMIRFRDYWLSVGRSTLPADRPRAEKAIKRMYEILGEKEPYIWWCDGPSVGSIVRTILPKLKIANLGENLGENLEANLRANLWENLGANLGENLRENLRANLRENLGANLGWYFWGQHELNWQAWALFPHKHFRAIHSDEQIERLNLWLELSQSCGWWQPFKNVVFICERPERQAIDEQGRLHHESGPALLCRDGWPIYAWHGVRVNYRVIEHPQDLTIKEIQSEQNAEVRRVMMERYGLSRYLMDSGAKLIHEDEMGKLYRSEVAEGEPLIMVELVNSTAEPDGHNKIYHLRVPPDMTMARQAVAWTFGMSAKEYTENLIAQT